MKPKNEIYSDSSDQGHSAEQRKTDYRIFGVVTFLIFVILVIAAIYSLIV